MIHSEINGIDIYYGPDTIVYKSAVIYCKDIQNIKRITGEKPAFVFDYRGEQLKFPCAEEELESLTEYFLELAKASPDIDPIEEEMNERTGVINNDTFYNNNIVEDHNNSHLNDYPGINTQEEDEIYIEPGSYTEQFYIDKKTESKTKTSPVLLLIATLVFFPVALWLISKNTTMSKKAKTIWVVINILWAGTLILIFGLKGIEILFPPQPEYYM